MSGNPVPSPISRAAGLYSGAPTTLTTGLETVPSDYAVAMLQFTGSISMGGATSIAPGTYLGQRLLTMPTNSSSGSVTWVIHGASPEAPILSPIRQSAYGASYCEVIEWVWDGSRWNLVSVFNPNQSPIIADNISGNLVGIGSLALGNSFLPTSVGFPITYDISSVSRLEFQLTAVDLDYASTPLVDHGGFSIPDGKLVHVINAAGGPPNDDSAIYLYDDAIQPGSGLQLATPKLTLRKGEWVLLAYHTGWTETGWYELARSRQDAVRDFLNPVGPFISFDFRGASTLRFRFTAGTTFNLASVTPSFSDATVAPFYDGQELLIINHPNGHAASVVQLDDEGTTAGVLVRLATATVNLTPGDSIRLRYDLTTLTWYEVHRALLV